MSIHRDYRQHRIECVRLGKDKLKNLSPQGLSAWFDHPVTRYDLIDVCPLNIDQQGEVPHAQDIEGLAEGSSNHRHVNELVCSALLLDPKTLHVQIWSSEG